MSRPTKPKNKLVNQLPNKARKMMDKERNNIIENLYLKKDMGLAEIGRITNLSRQRVEQILIARGAK
jgi:DNA-directed RNA polymerase specialized sigma subunit